MKKSLLVASLLLVIASACSKYAEGPRFSMQTRKARLCNDWKLSDYNLNGNNVFDANVTSKMTIDKDGTYSISNFTNELGQLQGTYSHGTWIFGEDETTVLFYEDTATVHASHEYSIKELKSKELVLVEELFQTGDVHRLTFKQQ